VITIGTYVLFALIITDLISPNGRPHIFAWMALADAWLMVGHLASHGSENVRWAVIYAVLAVVSLRRWIQSGGPARLASARRGGAA
jgi:hypothetical protein